LETIEIYAPLAERIGMQTIKKELQDLAFEELYPEIKTSIMTRLSLLRNNDNEIIDGIQNIIHTLLRDNQIKAEICGREKSPYSIWQKMQNKKVNFEQLSDVMAFRITVDNIQDCYRALGVIHSMYHMVPGLFKDFISLPKKNGYQSLHTVIVGPGQKRVEIQIRTHDMNQIAEYGVAAHWVYKQNEDSKLSIRTGDWLKELMEILNNSRDTNEFFENTKLEMYDDQVFCFTPKGSVVALPKGASAIDFAYAVHSDLGNGCVGVKINHKLAPLRTILQNGDQIEIITSKGQKPLPSWEKFAVTGKALNEIRKSIREEKSKEYINLGRVLLAQILEKRNVAMSDIVIQDLVTFYDRENIDDLFCAIGEGRISQGNIVKKISTISSKTDLIDKSKGIDISLPHHQKTSQVSIKGLIPGVAVHYAPCCSPIPGDQIVGLQQSKKGIVVHISGCEILQNYSQVPETWLDLSWDRDSAKSIYSAVLKVVCLNKPGSLAVIAIEAAKHGCNVSNFRIINRAVDFFDLLIDIEVKGINQIMNIIASLRSKDCIHSAERFSRD
jgi:GTP pyrophosphokinase